eukprot:scpid100550/ scgid6891/ 
MAPSVRSRSMPRSRSASTEIPVQDEVELRMRLLERQVLRLKGGKRHRSASLSSSSSSSSSKSSSSSDSSSSPERVLGKRRKSVKSSARKREKPVPGKRLNRSSYQHQYDCITMVADRLDQAKKYVKAGKAKKALKNIAKAQANLEDRLEWLVIADRHGHDTATRYAEGDDLTELLSDSGKRKRLRMALEASRTSAKAPVMVKAKQPPFRTTSAPRSAGSWSAG